MALYGESKGGSQLHGYGLAHARGGDILDIRKFIVSSQGPPRPCSPLTYGTALDTVHPFFAGFYGCGQSKNREINEINRSHHVSAQTPDNPRLAHIEPNLQFRLHKIGDGAEN